MPFQDCVPDTGILQRLIAPAMRPASRHSTPPQGWPASAIPAGSTNLCVLTSLIQTAKLQDRDPLRFLQTLFTQDPTAAQSALYHDSS